jgi:hypothetical protein
MRRFQAIVVAVLLLVSATHAVGSPLRDLPQASVFGTVTDAASAAPVGGARIQIGETTLETAPDGSFRVTTLALESAAEHVRVEVMADGYEPWRLPRLTLRAGRATEVQVQLRAARTPEVTPVPADVEAALDAAPAPSVQTAATTRRSVASVAAYPEYVAIGRVRHMADPHTCVRPELFAEIPIQQVRFEDYVRNVLPNEWQASWPEASLDAGAVAVKQYALHQIRIQKWRSQGYAFDLLDSTCDQVYKPNSAQPATDAAVARTWSTTLTRHGRLFATYYRAQDCYTVGDCMSQWGSFFRADAGRSAADILLHYYPGAQIIGAVEDCATDGADARPSATSDSPVADAPYRIFLPLVANCGG